jgi:uncharacterized damage-inducible protein DinB
MDINQLLETWEIHNRISLFLLDGIPPEHLKDVLASKGRNVGEQFAHLHNVRLMWLQVAAPDLFKKQKKIEKESTTKKDLLRRSLTASADAVKALLRKSLDSDGRIKGFKPHAVAFLGYLIAHESHHRGQIIVTLKQNGHHVDKKIQYGIWEWGVR